MSVNNLEPVIEFSDNKKTSIKCKQKCEVILAKFSLR